MFRRWSGTLNFSMSARDVTMGAAGAGGFFAGFSQNNHEGSIFIDLTIIAGDGKFLR
jgi:hypothetical protein